MEVRLEERVSALDRVDSCGPSANLTELLDHCIRILSRVTARRPVPDSERQPVFLSHEADEAMRQCQVLTELEQKIPSVVRGPLDCEHQAFTHTVKPRWTTQRSHVPSRDEFVDVETWTPRRVSTKPFDLGIFTSTTIDGEFDMWRRYLESHGGSTLYSKPWHTWEFVIASEVPVYEVSSASDWVRLVETYPLQQSGLVYPDWKAIGLTWSAVHMTLRAACAIQDFSFAIDEKVSAPAYWDVESTLWLHWSFDSASSRDEPCRS